MLPFRIHLLSLLSILCVTSCSTPEPKQEVAVVVPDKLVGRVSSVYPESNYMLIQRYQRIRTDIDAIFYSRNEDGSVNPVKMTEQRSGQFYVADLGKGIYAANDPVFMRDLRKNTQVDADEEDTKTPSIE